MTDATFSNEKAKLILARLDGWSITEEEGDEILSPFLSSLTDYSNKKITCYDLEQYYYIALDESYSYCNRWNIDDLGNVLGERYIDGVCCLAASLLWNKYNVRVNNEDMEDTYVTSYGGLLYKEAQRLLQPFINQRITGLKSYKKES